MREMEPEQETVGQESRRSHLISKVLSPAARLWLRSQVESVSELHVQIEGGDRQILSGHLPKVAIEARNVVYQGISLSYISLVGENIRVNLGQVLRGKPLRLLEIVPVQAEAVIQQADLNASLQAPLLANAVTDLLMGWLRSGLGGESEDFLPGMEDATAKLINPTTQLQPDQLTLSAELDAANRSPLPLTLRTGLQVVGDHTICLQNPCWLPHAQAKRGMPLSELDGFAIDLGSEVQLQQLTLETGQLLCRGRINVIP